MGRLIHSSYPSRISLAGGSTDQQAFINKFGRGLVVSFTPNIFNTIIITQDTFGKNTFNQRYILNYSKREETATYQNIINDIARESMLYHTHPSEWFFTTMFHSDINSVGSGLACSSAYTLAFNEAYMKLMHDDIWKDKTAMCEIAYQIEKRFNPMVGKQDIYGCAFPGFKAIHFEKDCTYHEQLPYDVFLNFDMYLIPTNVSRSSTTILKSLHFDDDSLLRTAENFVHAIQNNDTQQVIDLVKAGWKTKKKTSDSIVSDKKVYSLDQMLDKDSKILCHRLCGAGNGGYFLAFVDKREKTLPESILCTKHMKIEVIHENNFSSRIE